MVICGNNLSKNERMGRRKNLQLYQMHQKMVISRFIGLTINWKKNNKLFFSYVKRYLKLTTERQYCHLSK